jgi:iron complex transport system permease protein
MLRQTLLWAVLAMALILILLLSLAVGRFAVPLEQTLAILLRGFNDTGVAWTPAQQTVIEIVRAPRVLMAACAGAGLALCGTALQGVFRNPLVGPQIIGVSSGAGFGGALAILLGANAISLTASAFLWSAVALLAVVLMSRVKSRSSVLMLVLAGVVTSAFFGALTSLLVFVADPEQKLPGIVFWLLGSFATADYAKLAIIALTTGLGAVALLTLSWRINLLSLGDEDAAALGVKVQPMRWAILIATCVIIAGQVSVSGVIGWVGLVIPHIARMLVGADHRRLLPASMLIGAAYMAIVDDLARSLTPAEIPLGILTALVGAPIFVVLLRTLQHKGWNND